MIDQIAFDNSIAQFTSSGVDLTIASDATVALFWVRNDHTNTMTATCGGVSMTAIQTFLDSSAGRRFQLFALTNPPTGAGVQFRISGPPITSGVFIAATYKKAGYVDENIREATQSTTGASSHSSALTLNTRQGWMVGFGYIDQSSGSMSSLVFSSGDGTPSQRAYVYNGPQEIWAIHDTMEISNPNGAITMTMDPPGATTGQITIITALLRPKNLKGLTLS